MSTNGFQLRIDREGGFRFHVRPESGAPDFFLDEAPPLGERSGPAPTELLGAAVGGCLSASLLYCLGREDLDPRDLRTRVEGTVERNEDGRLRVTGLRVVLEMESEPDGDSSAEASCVEAFEDFCTVTESVRRGIPVSVEVHRTSEAKSGASAGSGG